MLTVKTKLKESGINGIGLFADEKILKGAITWRYNPSFDILFSEDEVSKMPQIQRELIEHFAFLSKTSGKYVYSIDDSRFTNHSENPNIDNSTILEGDTEICGIAIKDIEIGEEITVDYRTLDANDSKDANLYLNK